jgi:hypothetical protein
LFATSEAAFSANKPPSTSRPTSKPSHYINTPRT